MKSMFSFVAGRMVLGTVLCATGLHASEPTAPVSTNSAPASHSTLSTNSTASRERESVGPVRFASVEIATIKRKAALYGINPNLLQAAMIAEFEKGGGKARQSEAEFNWMVEMSARTLRRCLDEESNLTWALAFYVTGSFDHAKVDGRAFSFSRLVRKHFQELEKASPWNPQSNTKQKSKDKE